MAPVQWSSSAWPIRGYCGATGTSRYGPYLLCEGYQIAAISAAVTAAAAMANPARSKYAIEHCEHRTSHPPSETLGFAFRGHSGRVVASLGTSRLDNRSIRGNGTLKMCPYPSRTGLPRYRTSCPCGEQHPRSRNVRKNGPRRSGLCRESTGSLAPPPCTRENQNLLLRESRASWELEVGGISASPPPRVGRYTAIA